LKGSGPRVSEKRKMEEEGRWGGGSRKECEKSSSAAMKESVVGNGGVGGDLDCLQMRSTEDVLASDVRMTTGDREAMLAREQPHRCHDIVTTREQLRLKRREQQIATVAIAAAIAVRCPLQTV
jgi:hypothetical protein